MDGNLASVWVRSVLYLCVQKVTTNTQVSWIWCNACDAMLFVRWLQDHFNKIKHNTSFAPPSWVFFCVCALIANVTEYAVKKFKYTGLLVGDPDAAPFIFHYHTSTLDNMSPWCSFSLPTSVVYQADIVESKFGIRLMSCFHHITYHNSLPNQIVVPGLNKSNYSLWITALLKKRKNSRKK